MIRTSVAMQASAQLAALTQNVNTARAASRNTATGTGQASFLEQLQELSASVEAKATTATKEPSDMTLDEYKSYIYAKIDALPESPSHKMQSTAIFISDEGFKAMQNDPEYETWVMGRLKEDFQFNDPCASMLGGSYCVHNFGATKSEYQGLSWYVGCGGNSDKMFQGKAGGASWKRESPVAKANSYAFEKKQQMERLNKKRAQQDYLQELLTMKYWQNHQWQTKTAQGMNPSSVAAMPSLAGSSMMSPAAEMLMMLSV